MSRAPLGRALGLDLGTRRIGAAITDEDRTVATPLEVIDRRDASAAHRRIADLVDEWMVTEVVVGWPRHLDGSEGAAVAFVEDELAVLGDTLGVPVVTYDERLTTVTADRSLAGQGLDSRARRPVVDMVAAAVILQAWIDRKPS